MTESRIADVFAWEALDSRGKPTVACTVQLANGATGRAIVPSGASTGGHEAAELRDADENRHKGNGVTKAVANVNRDIAKVVRNIDSLNQSEVDSAMESLDDSPNLAGLGANAVLAVSLANLQAAASSRGLALWQHLSDGRPELPMPMVNIFSGGAHARGLLDIQDVLVVPLGAKSFAEAIEWCARVRQASADLLDSLGGSSTLVADEGGLSSALESNQAALHLVTDAIEKAGFIAGEDVAIAVDIAANQLWNGQGYSLKAESRDLTSSEWLSTVEGWCSEYPIVSIEDVLFEDDWEGWRSASQALSSSRQLLGDDLFATNLARLEKGISSGVANSVLVKPNQAGTVSRAAAVVSLAKASQYSTVVSARSGDTEDTWLADLAVGWRTGQIKVGSTMRSERTAKWNRLLEIEARAGAEALFAGPEALAIRRGK